MSKTFWVETKYDLRLAMMEEAGRHAVGPLGEAGREFTVMRDWDGSTVVATTVECQDALGALEVAQERTQALLWDLLDGEPVSAPVQVTIIDYERAVWLCVPEESKEKA